MAPRGGRAGSTPPTSPLRAAKADQHSNRHDSWTPRQAQLISAASPLFAERGYHAVALNDICATLGLTGPAFYRHFPNKQALLVAVFDNIITRHLDEVRDLVATTADPRELLERLIGHHVALVFEQAANFVTWRSEFWTLPEHDRKRLRYLQRLYTEEWVRALRRLHPHLPLEETRVRIHAAIALLQSPTEPTGKTPQPEIGSVLAELAVLVLIETPTPQRNTA